MENVIQVLDLRERVLSTKMFLQFQFQALIESQIVEIVTLRCRAVELLQRSVTTKYKFTLLEKADKFRGRFIFPEIHSTYGMQQTAFKYKR